MMIKKSLIIMGILSCIIGLFGCSNKDSKNKEQPKKEISATKNETEFSFEFDSEKHNELMQKYGLYDNTNLDKPVFMTIEDFFNGNKSDASIAANLTKRPSIKEFKETFEKILKNPKVIAGYVEIKEFSEDEWFYTDIVYFIGDIDKEYIAKETRNLLPDKIEYDSDNIVNSINNSYIDKNVIYIWWD